MKKAIFTSTIVFMFCFPAFADDVEGPEAGTGVGAEVAVDAEAEAGPGAGTTVAAEAAVEPGTGVVDDAAKPVARKGFGIGNDYARFTGRMQTLFLWRNDSDFDRTPPFYNANDQDVGVVGTFFAPMLEVTPVKQLRMVFEAELGLNIWSTHDPDNYNTSHPNWFRMAFRQAFIEGNFDKQKIGFRVGYERLFDPTGLFVGHWLGAANLWTRHNWGQITAIVAQMPDQTYEGIAFDKNNFNSDTILYGLRLFMPFDKVQLDAAIWGLHDTQVVGRTVDMMAITANFSGNWDWIKFGIDSGFQYGKTKKRAGGSDETTLAWAAQGYLNIEHKLIKDLNLLFDLNLLALSADDNWDGNKYNGGWIYSGRSRSKTIILTEDELRDRGGNMDELISQKRHADAGKFFLNRAGLVVTDVSFGLNYSSFFKPMLTVGTGWTQNNKNSFGSNFVGVETNLLLQFLYKQYLTFDVIGSALVPGKAAAAFINKGEFRDATDPIFQVEASLVFHF
ncbi:MAG TPA: hypothetical protein PLC97_04925 [Myxococcota bacterium]|nr:hypothetical protein [Myxococcota bacterium]